MSTNTLGTHQLKEPVKVGKEEVTEITLRRPKGRDMKRAMNLVNTVGDMTAAMIVNLGEVSPEVVDELDGGDWMALSDIVGNYMDSSGAKTPTAP